jgi:hypothetical protein
MRCATFALTTLWTAAVVPAATVVVHLSPVTPAIAATAVVPKDEKATCSGTVAGDTVTYADFKPGVAYEARITLADGTVLQGVDLGWYSRVPDRPHPDPLTDDDRQQMADVLAKVLSFYNHTEQVLLRGTHDRAVMLVDLRRDSPFHSDKGNEVIWRPELWYFENHHGGWEKVQQTDRVLRRERFPTSAAYHAVVDHLRWVPELGGLKVKPGGPDVTVTITATAGTPATRPAESPTR